MPRFPRTEPEIAALALLVTQGLGALGICGRLPDYPQNRVNQRAEPKGVSLCDLVIETMVRFVAKRQH